MHTTPQSTIAILVMMTAMQANDDKSINRRLYSNFNDNFATFLAPLLSVHKKVAEKNIEHREKLNKKKRKTIVASSSDSDEKIHKNNK
jgi:hypothetical protein